MKSSQELFRSRVLDHEPQLEEFMVATRSDRSKHHEASRMFEEDSQFWMFERGIGITEHLEVCTYY